MKKIIATIAFALLCNPVKAKDLGKVRNSAPRFILKSNKALFDVERCLIEVDFPSLATLYRAPDRPDQSLVYWDIGLGNPLLAELNGTIGGTSISVKGGGKVGREKIESCV